MAGGLAGAAQGAMAGAGKAFKREPSPGQRAAPRDRARACWWVRIREADIAGRSGDACKTCTPVGQVSTSNLYPCGTGFPPNLYPCGTDGRVLLLVLSFFLVLSFLSFKN
jgi:hypothetical protein